MRRLLESELGGRRLDRGAFLQKLARRDHALLVELGLGGPAHLFQEVALQLPDADHRAPGHLLLVKLTVPRQFRPAGRTTDRSLPELQYTSHLPIQASGVATYEHPRLIWSKQAKSSPRRSVRNNRFRRGRPRPNAQKRNIDDINWTRCQSCNGLPRCATIDFRRGVGH
jgi:hypothetical protein